MIAPDTPPPAIAPPIFAPNNVPTGPPIKLAAPTLQLLLPTPTPAAPKAAAPPTTSGFTIDATDDTNN